MERDRLITQLVDEIRSPIPLEPGGIQRVKGALQRRIGHRADAVKQRSKLTNRSKRGLGLLHWPGVAPDHTADGLSVQRFWKRFRRRDTQEGKPAI